MSYLQCPHCRKVLSLVYVEGTDVHEILDFLRFTVVINPDGSVGKADLDPSDLADATLWGQLEDQGQSEYWLEAIHEYVNEGQDVICPKCMQDITLYNKDEDVIQYPLTREVFAIPSQQQVKA